MSGVGNVAEKCQKEVKWQIFDTFLCNKWTQFWHNNDSRHFFDTFFELFEHFSDTFLKMTDFWQFPDTYLIVIWQIYITDGFLIDFWQLNDTFSKTMGPQKYKSTQISDDSEGV